VEGRIGRPLAHRSVQHERAIAIALALIAALAYANSLANGFTLDDTAIILENPLVHSLSGVFRAFAHPYWPEVWGWGQYRPLAIASFTLQWWMGGGAPWVFHLLNIAWHAAACVLLWRLLTNWLPSAAAACGALWFALQPVHVEAVASVVGQTELMATTFVLAACLAHRQGQRLAALWFALALLSKESGVVFIGLAMAMDLLGGVRPRRDLYTRYVVAALLYAGALGVLFTGQSMLKVAPLWYHASTADRWLTMLSVVPEYIRLLVAPLALHYEYGPQMTVLATSITPTVALGAALLCVIILVAVTARTRAPEITLGLAWFAIAIAPVANVFFASGVVLAERTLYLPSAGAALIVGWVVVWAAGRTPRRAAALATIGLAALAARTWTRTPVWHDDVALTIASVNDSPLSYKAHHAAGVLLAETGRWPEAAVQYRMARELFPLDGDAYRGAAEAAMVVHDYDAAGALLDSARRLAPQQVQPWIRLADVRYRQGRFREAAALAFGAYEMCPDSTRAIAIVVNAALRMGDIRGARDAVKRGLADHPSDERLRHESLYVAGLQPTQ
jgi:protein O-mannosyl-transferase